MKLLGMRGSRELNTNPGTAVPISACGMGKIAIGSLAGEVENYTDLILCPGSNPINQDRIRMGEFEIG
ncbi:hypothetical protein PABG_11104 [Paracoccidioides brasiliensis Pb03]|nr:hypothetical protein PABG_11104 [Paracoccidioides brasiliensis Pb03]